MAKPKLKSTSVSVRGDREYVNTLRALAARRGITLAELTRRALDTQYGAEVEEISSFFANSVASKQQTLHEIEMA